MEGGAEEGGGAGPEEEGAGVGPEAEGAGAGPEEGWRAPGSASAGGRFEVQQFAQEEVRLRSRPSSCEWSARSLCAARADIRGLDSRRPVVTIAATSTIRIPTRMAVSIAPQAFRYEFSGARNEDHVLV